MKQKRERESERARETKRQKKRTAENERERSEKRDVHPSVFCSHQKLVCEYSLFRKKWKKSPRFHLTKLKKKEHTHTHIEREEEFYLSPATSKVIYTHVLKKPLI